MIPQNVARDLVDDSLSYQDFLAKHGSPGDIKNWTDVNESCSLSDEQADLLSSFSRQLHVVCIAGAWCGDCVRQGPILNYIASASDQINLLFIDRDALAEEFKATWTVCGGLRVPQVLFFNEDYQFLGHAGDRTITRYRKLARLALGDEAPINTSFDQSQKTVLEDWLEEFERIHLIARLSPRLRQKHAD